MIIGKKKVTEKPKLKKRIYSRHGEFNILILTEVMSSIKTPNRQDTDNEKALDRFHISVISDKIKSKFRNKSRY
jgi:hypothetical protein